HCCQGAASEPAQAFFSTDRSARTTELIIRHAEIIVSDAQIQREIPVDLPAVFEEHAEVLRAPVSLPKLDSVTIPFEHGVFGIANVEALFDTVYRAGEIGQQSPR